MTTTTRALPYLTEIGLPDFGMPDAEPLLPADLYVQRLEQVRSAMDARAYDHLVVWADREHSANLAYLSGFDPRFEEALLVVGTAGLVLVGLAGSPWLLVAGALVTGAAYGGLQSVTLIKAFADGEDHHRVSVAWNVGFDLGTGLGAAVVGLIAAQSSFRAAFWALACGCLLAAVVIHRR